MLRGEHAVSEVDMRLETSGDRKSCFEAKRIATVQEKRDSEKRGPGHPKQKSGAKGEGLVETHVGWRIGFHGHG